MIGSFLISFLVCVFLNSLFLLLDRRIRWFRLLKDKATGVSRAGGIGLVFAFLISLSAAGGALVPSVLPVIFVLTFLLGFFDDILVLSPLWKFSGQVLIAGLLAAGGIRTQIIFFPEAMNVAISVFWVVGIMNAFNFLDILDGLAAGVGAIISLAFFAIGAMTGHGAVSAMAISLVGVDLAFLCFNFPRARLYMGDTGSLFNGIVLAAMSILVSYAPAGREAAVFLPLLILGLPLADLFFLVVMRLARRKPLAQKSADHFVLRLVARGMTVQRAVLVMYLCAFLFSVSAVLFLKGAR